MKRKITIFLVFVLLISGFNFTGIYAAEDLTKHWAAETLLKWQNENYLRGDQNGNVFPDNPLTRAEFVALLNRAMNIQHVEGKNFAPVDIKVSDWFYNDMMIALENGYILLSADSKVNPEKKITRQEIITIMSRFINKPGEFDIKKVKDYDKISDWANNPIQSMIAGGYINGNKGNINPLNNTSKAEAIVLINRAKENERQIYFNGEYELGEVNKLSILSGDIKIKSSKIKELIINKEVKGKIELENTKVESIKNESLEVEIYVEGVKYKVEGNTLQEMPQYKDGEYEGKAFGYKSDIKVKITIKDGKLTKIDILEENEDKIYFKAAKKIIDKILKKQDTKVDTSSGATLSSNGIKFAVENALEKALIKKKEKINKDLKDGEYVGEGAGYAGTVKVKVKIKEHKISEIELISNNDDSSYMISAKNLIQVIKKKQNAEVDVVSGATYSSEGLINAVKDALSQALGKTDAPGKSEFALKNKGRNLRESQSSGVADSAIEKKFTGLKDGVYYATASGYYSNSIEVKVTVVGGKIASIEVLRNGDDQSYFSDAQAKTLAERIKDAQGTNVDNISGATKSSYGLKNAVAKALELASGKTTEISQDFDGKGKSLQNVEILKSAKIKNVTVTKELVIKEAVEDSDVTLENVQINGKLLIYGGGSKSVYLINSNISGDIEVDKPEKADDGHGDDHDHDHGGQNGNKPTPPPSAPEKKEYQRVRVVFKDNTQAKSKVILRNPAIIQTEGNSEVKELVISKGMNNKHKIEIKGNINKLDIKSDVADIVIKENSVIKTIELPNIVEDYKEGKKEYIIKPDKTTPNNSKDFKLIIENGVRIEKGKNKEKNNTSWLDEDEKTKIRGKLDQAVSKYKKGLDVNKIEVGTYEGNGKGFDTSKHIRTSIKIVNDGGVLKVESGKIVYFGDSGSYQPAARRMFDFINGKTLDEVIENIAVMQVQYEYLNAIDNVVDERERYNKAVELIGRTAAAAIRSNVPKDATKRILNISAPIKKFIIGEYPDKKPMFDGISSATMSAGGVAHSINNALKLAVHDAEVGNKIHQLKISGEIIRYPFNRTLFARAGDPLNLEKLQVMLVNKDGTEENVPYSKFSEKSIKIFNTETNKEILNGMILPIEKQTIKAMVKHLNSQREDYFDIIVDRKHSDNYVIGMEYKIGNGEWKAVESPVFNTDNTPENPFKTNNIQSNQSIKITADEKESYKGQKVKIRLKLKRPELHDGVISRYVVVGQPKDFEFNEWKEGSEKPHNPKQLTFRFENLDEYTTKSTNWNINFFYKLEFNHIIAKDKDEDSGNNPPVNRFDITKTVSIDAFPNEEQSVIIIDENPSFAYENVNFTLEDSDNNSKMLDYSALKKDSNIEYVNFTLDGKVFENYTDLTPDDNGKLLTITIKIKGIDEEFEAFLVLNVKQSR